MRAKGRAALPAPLRHIGRWLVAAKPCAGDSPDGVKNGAEAFENAAACVFISARTGEGFAELKKTLLAVLEYPLAFGILPAYVRRRAAYYTVSFFDAVKSLHTSKKPVPKLK